MAYSKQTWDTTSYVNPTRMNHMEDGIESADFSNGGSITGTLNITGNEQIYRDSNRVNIYPSTDLSGNRDFILPDRSGIAAVINQGWDVEFGQYNLDYNGQTIELTGIKMTNKSNSRYFILGSVLSGSVLGGRLVVYNSWNSVHWVVVAPTN